MTPRTAYMEKITTLIRIRRLAAECVDRIATLAPVSSQREMDLIVERFSLAIQKEIETLEDTLQKKNELPW
ncbi:MAG: hypothetical protein HY236_14440 [Acidobacteria bacterium]|nr:hypothetical protein [Acidobacteriota bacterium]